MQMRSSSEAEISLKEQWTGFDLVKIGVQKPVCYRRGDLILISGCITSVNPMKNQAGWAMPIGSIDARIAPSDVLPFVCPTQMSRYEGIFQCGTSLFLDSTGSLKIFFAKSANPMVLHLSGLCGCISRDEDAVVPLQLARYEQKDWNLQCTRSKKKTNENNAPGEEGIADKLEIDTDRPPGLRRCGNLVFLQGLLKASTYGAISQRLLTLPEGYRPRREVRWLANLLVESTEGYAHVGHSVAVTLRPDGAVSVQGGNTIAIDSKGNLRVMQQKKKGQLCLDGIRFTLSDGVPLQVVPDLQPVVETSDEAAAPKPAAQSKLNYLIGASGAASKTVQAGPTAICVKTEDVVILEGHLTWPAKKSLTAKEPLVILPTDCRPRKRETFFTRGGSDLEERCRVDIDRYGRIFCPEGAPDGRLELSGVIFVAAGPESVHLRPRSDADELRLQYQNNDTQIKASSFDGHELLEQFVRRTNLLEWQDLSFHLDKNAYRTLHLPCGTSHSRGSKSSPMNLGRLDEQLWKQIKNPVDDKFRIKKFHTLLQMSDRYFEHVAEHLQMALGDIRRLRERRLQLRRLWAMQRQQGLTTFAHIQGLASDIVDQMFEHWDFRAQINGAIQNDFRAPQSIEHLFPQRWGGGQDRLIKKNVKPEDRAKFEEIRRFFYLYETTGNQMTHCSLMGTADVFTTTGKWFFPDSADVQKQLFENIEWLFPRKMYLYISERQTSRFPFIEDLDIQCKSDWREWTPEDQAFSDKVGRKIPSPPDELVMFKPKREGSNVYGDPGEVMRRRAEAIHMIYPQFEYLEAHVYSASGYNKGKDMLKSSFHLVWPQLIVDSDRAPIIRYVTLGIFAKETKKQGSNIKAAARRLAELHESNIWELIFDSTTINARNGLRLPFSDKASMKVTDPEQKKLLEEGKISKTSAKKSRVKEDRPSVAIGTIRFDFGTDPDTGQKRLESAKWVADRDSRPIRDWIALGTCRRDASQFPDLTPWYLGQEVLEMLPTKRGENFYQEFDGEDQNGPRKWETHKPFPNIRRTREQLSCKDFVTQFEEALVAEREALEVEGKLEVFEYTLGSWVAMGEKSVTWRTTAQKQTDAKYPSFLLGTGKVSNLAEVVYLEPVHKVIVTGPEAAVEAILRAMDRMTKPDDNHIMPIYDISQMS